MIRQPSFFDAPRCHRHDPDTSRKAARSMVPQANSDRGRVLAEFKRRGPSIADEVAEALGWEPYRVRRRVSELKQAHLLRDTGTTRPTASGRRACVLEAV